uniref:ubiquitinyl hydrolase 1 n=2 Tax=Lygus hesperus TaxID=30085 RepID=A0A0A9WW70_LYGHE
MELIFHEKQEGSLCAQHCLNALLQGPYFTPVDLATLAQKMDDEERAAMAESGVDTEEYRRFIEQPSGNMDDSGFFSVQVISSALAVWSLELLPLKSPEPVAAASRENPQDQMAYICNYREHWFTIRKLGNQWFNLNSLLSGPELVSTTYLSILLAQLQQEGYSIFIVLGGLPACPAHEALLATPAVPRAKPRPQPQTRGSSDDPELEKAIRMSIAQQDEEDAGLATALRVSMENDQAEDPSLNAAIRLSLQPGDEAEPQSSSTNRAGPMTNSSSVESEGSDEALLSEAIRLSLEGQDVQPADVAPAREPPAESTAPAQSQPSPSRTRPTPVQTRSALPSLPRANDEPDLDEIRRRRLAYLEKRKT